jgi:hypothetical protein
LLAAHRRSIGQVTWLGICGYTLARSATSARLKAANPASRGTITCYNSRSSETAGLASMRQRTADSPAVFKCPCWSLQLSESHILWIAPAFESLVRLEYDFRHVESAAQQSYQFARWLHPATARPAISPSFDHASHPSTGGPVVPRLAYTGSHAITTAHRNGSSDWPSAQL